MNEKNHIYDDCIGNPPFDGAIKILDENYLTEPQRKHFEERRPRLKPSRRQPKPKKRLRK
jgi:hypothetical protein